jgi:hypothetical protein
MSYNPVERLELVIANIQVQDNKAYFDDILSLEEVLAYLRHAYPIVDAVVNNPKAIAILEAE